MMSNYMLQNKLFNRLLILFFLSSQLIISQTDEEAFKSIYKTALTNGNAYNWLDYLSNEIGGRLSGSYNAEQAVNYTKYELEELGLDRVFLQPVMVPRWVRGAPEFAYIETAPGQTTQVNICALGGSVPTASGGLKANLIEVKSFEELEQLVELCGHKSAELKALKQGYDIPQQKY